MSEKRRVEIFHAGCGLCDDAVVRVRELACEHCEVIVQDMARPDVLERARRLGIEALPAVAVDGRLAECCAGRGLDAAGLRAAGIGSPPA